MPGGRPKGEITHGTIGCYVNEKCRCRPCRGAWSSANKARNHEKLYGPDGERGPQWQANVLADLAGTGDIVRTAKNLGISWQSVDGARRSLADTFGAEVERLTTMPAEG